jgi:DNA-nicking Smr family endonuclease
MDPWLEYTKDVNKLNKKKRLEKKFIPKQNYSSIMSEATQSVKSIDLHGLTKDQAFASLKTFLINSYNNNVKKILVITGKGNPNNLETIKILTPRWLEHTELKHYIADYGPAPIKHGGSGALEIILNKKK